MPLTSPRSPRASPAALSCPGLGAMVGMLTLLAACARTGPAPKSATMPPPPPVGAKEEEPRRTGLVPPTAEERAAMNTTMVTTGDVRPNRLGLERINAERAKQGLPPLKITPAPDGREVTPAPVPP